MRTKLKKFLGERRRFKGIFEREGIKSGWVSPQKTILIKNIQLIDSSEILTNHVWLNLTKGFSTCTLEKGDTLTFDARVEKYTKGYKGFDTYKQIEKPTEEDFRLIYPTKIIVEKERLLIHEH